MDKLRKCIVSLLVVIAVLLTLNLVVMGSRTANAEAAVAGEGDPYIVKLLPISKLSHARVWSDGRVDWMVRDNSSCDFQSKVTFGPVEHPFPVVEAVHGVHHNSFNVMMTFEDSRVDLVPGVANGRCTLIGIGTPSLCTADTDRDGDVDVVDLLALLGQWGSCE